MPRLKGSGSTSTPRAAATALVPSVDPSSTTKIFRPGSAARISSITRPIACSSLKAGTMAIRLGNGASNVDF
jgi:hypothetical protein